MFNKVTVNTSGQVNKDVVAAILARAITGGNAKEYLRKIADDESPEKK